MYVRTHNKIVCCWNNGRGKKRFGEHGEIRVEKHLQCARIGRGKHQKAWKQEILRVHNSNPLQRPYRVH